MYGGLLERRANPIIPLRFPALYFANFDGICKPICSHNSLKRGREIDSWERISKQLLKKIEQNVISPSALLNRFEAYPAPSPFIIALKHLIRAFRGS